MSESDKLKCYEPLSQSALLALIITVRGIDRVVKETKTSKADLYAMILTDIPFTDSVIGYLNND